MLIYEIIQKKQTKKKDYKKNVCQGQHLFSIFSNTSCKYYTFIKIFVRTTSNC